MARRYTLDQLIAQEEVREALSFLIYQLSKLEGALIDPSEACSQYYSHIVPAIARVRTALLPAKHMVTE